MGFASSDEFQQPWGGNKGWFVVLRAVKIISAASTTQSDGSRINQLLLNRLTYFAALPVRLHLLRDKRYFAGYCRHG